MLGKNCLPGKQKVGNILDTDKIIRQVDVQNNKISME